MKKYRYGYATLSPNPISLINKTTRKPTGKAVSKDSWEGWVERDPLATRNLKTKFKISFRPRNNSKFQEVYVIWWSDNEKKEDNTIPVTWALNKHAGWPWKKGWSLNVFLHEDVGTNTIKITTYGHLVPVGRYLPTYMFKSWHRYHRFVLRTSKRYGYLPPCGTAAGTVPYDT